MIYIQKFSLKLLKVASKQNEWKKKEIHPHIHPYSNETFEKWKISNNSLSLNIH